jgi:hypothetical protein
METKIYSHEELARLDPAKLISHAGHRLMTVLEVGRHLIDGDWPDQEIHQSLTQREVMATATPKPGQVTPTEPKI